VAGLLAVIVRPAIDWMHRQLGIRYGWAVTLVYTVLIFMVPTLFVLLIPALINAVNYIIDLDYEAIIQRSIAWGENTLIALKAVQMPSQALDMYIDQTVDMLLNELQNAIPTTTPSPPTMSSVVQVTWRSLDYNVWGSSKLDR
jgi:predicted PurR-regulated permease PerM